MWTSAGGARARHNPLFGLLPAKLAVGQRLLQSSDCLVLHKCCAWPLKLANHDLRRVLLLLSTRRSQGVGSEPEPRHLTSRHMSLGSEKTSLICLAQQGVLGRHFLRPFSHMLHLR